MRGKISDYTFETYDDGLVIETPIGDVFLERDALEDLAELIKEVLEDE